LWATLGLLASLRGLGTGKAVLDGAILGVLWASVVMVFSRTGWLALLIAVIVVIVTTRRQLRPRELAKRLGAAAAALVMTIALLFAVDVEGVGGELPLQFAFRLRQGWDLVASITGLFESSAAFEDQFNVSEQRADVWPEYFGLFLDNPLTGVGLGVGWETNSVGQEPHNLFLELGAETGVLGLVAFAVLLGTIVRTGGGLIGAVALAVSLLPVMTQTVLFEPTWWFAAGLFVAGRESLGIAHPPP
ncbi:MAG: O-antigen ligase family protein, partial [Actinomycetota bacterium]|nr:O-antigen ligase family protein [Actinomycetota bacterium]